MSQEHLPMAHTFFRTLMAICFLGGAVVFFSGGSWLYAGLLVVIGVAMFLGSARTGSQ